MKIYLFLLPLFLFSQETETINKTNIYSSPSKSSDETIGELYPGATIIKLKKDASGKFIKATVDFYIPIESLAESRVSHLAGVDQVADYANYHLIKATKKNKRISISLRVRNTHQTKSLDFSAMVLLKVVGKGENKGELNPFEGKYQDLAIIQPNSSIVAELVYDFKSTPENVELICTGKLKGESVYYNLGF